MQFQPLQIIQLVITLFSVVLSLNVAASQAGWRMINVPPSPPQDATIPVALYYPTQAPARPIVMGPFTANVAAGSAPEATFKGLIVLSHGTGGTELGHSSLAEALARHGYLVAALRHPGDNWQDRSLLAISAQRYFIDRPQHVSRVIDALLANPEWASRIAKDAQGPRIGAVGHSAGGYSVLALAGAQPDLSRLTAHCASQRAADPIFCSIGASSAPASNSPTPVVGAPVVIPTLTDGRVRAVVAMTPLGVLLSPESLAKVSVPTAIYQADQDRFLVPRFHAQWVASQVAGAALRRVKNAGHFAFMDTPSMPIMSEDGDIGSNPPGFDRGLFLQQLGCELPAFFDKAWP